MNAVRRIYLVEARLALRRGQIRYAIRIAGRAFKHRNVRGVA